MKNRLMTLAAAAILLLSFTGTALASEDPGKPADAAMTAEIDAFPSLTKHHDSEGNHVVCVTEKEFRQILEWYNAELMARERRAEFNRIVDAFEVDP